MCFGLILDINMSYFKELSSLYKSTQKAQQDLRPTNVNHPTHRQSRWLLDFLWYTELEIISILLIGFL